MQPITAEMFEEWRQHPVTLGVFKALFNERECMKENVIQGNYEAGEEAKVRGRCQAIGLLLIMTYEELIFSMSEAYDGKR